MRLISSRFAGSDRRYVGPECLGGEQARTLNQATW